MGGVSEIRRCRKTENRVPASMPCLKQYLSRAGQQSQSWLSHSLRQSVLPVLLAQSPPATLGKVWLFWLLQPYLGSRRPPADAAHLCPGHTASLPSQPAADMASGARAKSHIVNTASQERRTAHLAGVLFSSTEKL